MAPDQPLGAAARRVLDHLKRQAPSTTADLAEALAVSRPAVRIQLDLLVEHGLVEGQTLEPAGRGRPATGWQLTPLAMDAFPDRHRDLTVELLAAVEQTLGADGLAAVLAERDRGQLADLRAAMADDRDVDDRVATLARLRSAQGYMAEVVAAEDHLLLVEHHCPVCEAATSCQGLCRGELELFRDALGPEVAVERIQHLLAGDPRCVYQIRPHQSC